MVRRRGIQGDPPDRGREDDGLGTDRGMLNSRSFVIFMGAALLAMPLSLAAGFGAWTGVSQFAQASVSVVAAGVAMIAAFVPGFMKSVDFLHRMID